MDLKLVAYTSVCIHVCRDRLENLNYRGKQNPTTNVALIYSGRSQRSWGDSHCPSAQDECLLDTCTYITLFYIYLYIHCIYTVIINKPGPCRKQRNSVGGKVKKETG